jgi:hypothetical protein
LGSADLSLILLQNEPRYYLRSQCKELLPPPFERPWRSANSDGAGFTGECARPGHAAHCDVKTPATSHEVRLSKIEAWLESDGRSPNGQALKVRMRELLGL